ncbi:MAG TPA: alanine racemase, partial [Candidatus Binataceae bacterium]|nr:alanine racemase [Candidatus Binataceae bacterium]
RPQRLIPVLVEINLGGEASKTGVAPEGAEALIQAVRGKVEVLGLMAIPPPGPGAEHSRPYFARLRDLRDRLAAATGLALSELSMGMTDDFEVAIEQGATIVRVGRAIFGERPR